MSTLEEIIHATRSVVPPEGEPAPFKEVFWSWVVVARKRLREQAERELGNLLPEAVHQMEESLVRRWGWCATPSLALELSISKMQGDLHGETPEDRYFSFLQERVWNHENLRAFFEEYKELGRMIVLLLDLWVAQSVEFLKRVAQDLPLLATTFNEGRSLGKLSFLAQNAGDFHAGGRSVYHLKFESGKEIFYKPKNLAFGALFQEFISEMNAQGLPLDLKGYITLARGEYGWEEMVQHLPCETPEQVTRYFQRTGMLLALLYLFDGTDIHYENLIASGEYPMLIDLETFFHSSLAHPDKEESIDVYNHSVLRTALLPTFIEKNGQRGPDVSGLSAEDATFKVYTWQKIGTDELTREEESVTEKWRKHRVFLEGVPQQAADHVEEIVYGFKAMYAFVKEKKELFIQKRGWIDRLAALPVRMVMRATRLYAYLLDRLTSPQIILHQSERDQELEILNKILQDPAFHWLVPLIEEEKRAILQGDVPFFITYPKENHLYSGNHFVLHSCLDGSAYTDAIKRIEAMSDEECEIQESFIRKAFYARDAGFHSKEESEKVPNLPLLDESRGEDEIIDEVKSIANSLLANALRSRNGSLGWIALEPNPQYGRFELQPAGDSLYSGKIGIALFLSALYAITKEERWKEAAMSALQTIRTAIGKGYGKRMVSGLGIGGMSGAGGLIYGLCKISGLLQEPALIQEATTVALSITDRHLEQDKSYDIIGGAAGLILALVVLWEITHEQKIVDLALAASDHLSSKAEETQEGGISWRNSDGLFMLGFSHGNAGIAYALLRLATLTKKPELFHLVDRAHAYERALFSPDRNNWPRLDSEELRTFPVQWCHGAVGIGFGRLASTPFIEDSHLLHEVETALKTTEENLFLRNVLNLCCGSAGKLEFLRCAHPHFPRVEKTIPRLISSLITHYKNRPTSYFEPSLMQGASGVGYTLLRTVDREGVLPQVLLME